MNILKFRRFFSPRLFAGAVGIILLIAAALKAYDIELFMRQIRDYQIITNHILIVLSAWGLIIVEFVLGTSLLIYFRPRIVVPLTTILFCIFIGATLTASISGVVEDCGCFGSWVKRSPAGAVIEDLFILAAIALSWPYEGYTYKQDGRWKIFVIAASLAAGVFLPVILGDPIKALVGINAGNGGEQNIFTVKGLEGIDLKKGSFLYVLIGADCSHCRDSVEDFNDLANAKDLPKVIALSADPKEDRDSFVKDLDVLFPVIGITEDEFYRLLGMGYTPEVSWLSNSTCSRPGIQRSQRLMR